MYNLNLICFNLHLFLFVTLLIKSFAANKTHDEECFVQRNGTHWKLTYHDEFDPDMTEETFDKNWKVENEDKNPCHGDWVGHVSCNLRDNVHLLDGYLVLSAHYEPYLGMNFTAAQVSSRSTFGYGRYEVRASHPNGAQMRAAVFTVHFHQDENWQAKGDVLLASTLGNNIVHRTFYPASKKEYRFETSNYPTSADLYAFHLYGIEWNSTMLRFFFDDDYSAPFTLSPSGNNMAPGGVIRFQLGVGLEGYGQAPIPLTGDQLTPLRWKCPAYVIDYLRVYKKAQKRENDTKEVSLFPNCDQKWGKGFENEDAKLKAICQKSLKKIGKVFSFSKFVKKSLSKVASFFGSYKFILTMLLLILILLLAYMVIQIRKKQTNKNDKNLNLNFEPQDQINEKDNIYCIPKDDEEYYEILCQDYLPLEDQLTAVVSDYLPLKDKLTESDLEKKMPYETLKPQIVSNVYQSLTQKI